MPNPQMSSYRGVLAYCMRYINIAKSQNKTSVTIPIVTQSSSTYFFADSPVDEMIVGIGNAAYALATFDYKVTLKVERRPELALNNETPMDEIYHELIIEWSN